MHYSPLMQSQCALIFVVGGAYGASPRVYLVRYLGSRHLAVCVEVGEAIVVLAASPISPCAAAHPMAGGGPRSRNPIHRLFAWLSHIWSLLNSIADKLQGVVDKLQRVERALETPGPKGLNPDAWVGLRPASAKAYSDAVQAFVAFVEKQRLPLEFPAEIDRAIVIYGRETRRTRAQMETLVAAIKRGCPGLRRQLSWADSTLKNMLRYSPPVHKVPMMRFVALCIGHRMALDGWPRAGGLLILQVCLGLRPGELLAIRREDIVPGRRDLHNGNAVVALGKRHGTKAGRPQFVIVHANEDPIAMALIAAFASTTPPGSALSSLDYSQYSRCLHCAARQLGLSTIGYSPHSPRAGWATQLRLSGVPFAEIQERGRWQTASALRIYLDAVAASATLLHKTHALLEFSQYLEADFIGRFPWWRQTAA